MKNNILHLYRIIFNRQNPVLHKMAVFLFCVIFIISLSACFYSNVMYANNNNDDINKLNLQLSNQASEYINSEIDRIYKTSIHMAWLPVLDNATNDTTSIKSREQVNYDLSVALRQFTNKLPYIHSIYFYDINKDIIISSDFNVKSSNDYFKYAEVHEGPNYLYFTQMISHPKLFEVLPSSKLVGIGQNFYIMPFATAYPLNDTPKGTIVLNVDIEKFMKSLKDLGKEYGTEFLIINTDHKIIASSGDMDNPIDGMNILSKNLYKAYDGTSLLEISNKEYFTSYSPLSEQGWMLCVLTPKDALKKTLITNNIKVVVVAILVLFLSIILSYHFSRRVFKPVLNTADNIRLKLNPQIINDLQDVKDDTIFIEQAVTRLLDSYNKLSSILEEHKSVLDDRMLMDIIFSEIDGITGKDSSKLNSMFLDNIFTYHYYIVLLFEIDNYRQIQYTVAPADRKVLRHEIAEIIQDKLSSRFTSKCMNMHSGKFLAVVNTDATENIVSDIKQVCESIKSTKLQNENITISVGIGGIYEGIEGVRKSYDEAATALNRKFTQGISSIIFAGDVIEDAHNQNWDGIYYGFEDEEKLINMIKTASKDDLLKTVYALVDRVAGNNADYSKTKFFFSQLSTTLLRGLKLMNIKYDDIFEKGFNIYRELSYCDTTEELKAFTFQQFEKVCDYIEGTKQSKQQSPNSSLADKIVVFIKDHYKENISLKELSDEFGYSQSYISIMFKDCIGENFVDYLNQFRISIAKELLKDHSKPIHEVAEEVGYNSDNSFIRIFKKYVGITPGKYREQLD